MMTIGEVLNALEGVGDDLTVRFAFGGVSPTRVDSWRGIYAEAALGFSSGEYGDPRCTVGALRKELLGALEQSYEGWRGGTYEYTRETPLHVDNQGCYTNTELVKVQVLEYSVVLYTEWDIS